MNEAAAGIASSKRKIPVILLPTGTSNDFAAALGLPPGDDAFCDMIDSWHAQPADLGLVNGVRYFANVAAGGLLTDVAHETSPELKRVLGRAAYYLESLRKLPSLAPFRLRIESAEYTGESELYIFLVSNGTSSGGFRLLAPKADYHDGYLDCLLIKMTDIRGLIPLVLSTLSGAHTNNPNVIYFQTKKVSIYPAESRAEAMALDVDGEYACKLPVTIEVVTHGFSIIVPPPVQ